MSLALKYAIPLISNNLKLEYITEDPAFEGIYTYNHNAPCLHDHIFLMYKFCKTDHKQFDRHMNLINDPCIHSWGKHKIDGELHIIYVFPIFSATINHIRRNRMILGNPNDLTRIIMFWKGTDKDVNTWAIFRHRMPYVEWKEISIPEYDYE